MTKVLLSCIAYPCGAGRFVYNALKALHYDVVSFGPEPGGYLPWEPSMDFSKWAWAPDVSLPYPFRHVFPVQDALALCGPVDLIIQCDARFYLTGQAPCKNVVWAVDNHVCDYGFSKEDVHYDRFFAAHSWAYVSDNPIFEWLPCAYEPTKHYVDKSVAKEFDAALIGVPYPARVALVQALQQKADAKVLVGLGVLDKDYNHAYNSAVIGLVQSIAGDVPMRLFENAAMGLCLLTDRQRDLEKLGLKEDRDYVGYSTIDEAVEKMRWLKANPARRAEIAESGRQVLAIHTYANRAQQILTWAGLA